MSWPRPPRLIAWVLLVVAAAGQIRVWSSGRGFWLDELSIAVNLRERSWSELPGGLEYYQVAPVGWLAIAKALREWVGEDEVVLRLPSLAAGLALLVLTMVIARRAVGEWAAVTAVGLVGFSPALLYYSGELKQYAVEAAVALGLLLLGDELIRRDSTRRRDCERGGDRWRWPVFAAGAGLAAVAVVLSFSALIVLAGVSAGLATIWLARRRWSALAVLALVAAPAAALGGGLAWYRRSQPLAPNQDTYFSIGMPEPGAGVGETLAWLPQAWTGFVADPLAWRGGWWTLVLVAGGLLALLLRRRRHWAAMLAGVLVMAVAAAVLRGYPLADRVALYLVAPVILLAVAGLDGAVRGIGWLGGRIQVATVAAAGAAVILVAAAVVVVGPPVGRGAAQMLAPQDPDRGREVLADLAGRVRPGDVVIANWFADQLVRWYGLEVAGLVRMVPADDPALCRPGSVDALLAGASRAWYLHGAPPPSEPDDHTVRVVAQLAERGQIVDAWTLGQGAFSNEPGWVLLDLTAGPDPAPPVVAPHPYFACLTATESVANVNQLTRGGRA